MLYREKHGNTAYLKIKITSSLGNILGRCRDNNLSPYIIHRKLDAQSRQNYNAESKQHFSQVTPDYLTKTFSYLRDQLPQFKSLPSKKRPTFHEVRSLGITLYEKQGINAQALAGHKTRVIIDKYKEGHKPEWTEVEAGLELVDSPIEKRAEDSLP